MKESLVAERELLEENLEDLFRVYMGTDRDFRQGEVSVGGSDGPSTGADDATTKANRNKLVITIAKVRAGFRCEMDHCQVEPFIGLDGRSFVEVHHIIPLSEHGLDVPENVAALCPMHHREAHHGLRASGIKLSLQRVRADARTGSIAT